MTRTYWKPVRFGKTFTIYEATRRHRSCGLMYTDSRWIFFRHERTYLNIKFPFISAFHAFIRPKSPQIASSIMYDCPLNSLDWRIKCLITKYYFVSFEYYNTRTLLNKYTGTCLVTQCVKQIVSCMHARLCNCTMCLISNLLFPEPTARV
jgi:hypothetical protein